MEREKKAGTSRELGKSTESARKARRQDTRAAARGRSRARRPSSRAEAVRFSTPPDWVADAVFYQIFPDRFRTSTRVEKPANLEPWGAPPTRNGFQGGDLYGIAEGLDYLCDLGITALYLNPIFTSASNHRYHPYDWLTVDPLLGGDEAFRTLLAEAHDRGIRIILDGVFNHASRGFWPFHHILENGPDSPYIDWFIVKGFPLHAYEPSQAPNYEAWWGLHALPKLNIANPEVRAYLFRAIEHWTRAGIDGWRLDVPTEIGDPSFWREFRDRVRAIAPEAYIVGEIWDERLEWLAEDRFDALMNYPFARRALGFFARDLDPELRLNRRTVDRLNAPAMLREIIAQATTCPHATVCSQLNLLSSHDTPRFLTQTGGDHRALWLATLLQMTLPGTPCVYYGDEVGLEGGDDPACRGAFPWDERRWHLPTRDFFRRAIALRRSENALRRGRFEPLAGRDGVIAFLRRSTEGPSVLVALNATERDRRAALDLPLDFGGRLRAVELWDPGAAPPVESDRGIALVVPSRSGRVLRLEEQGG